jgi:hypothetical protein
MVEDTPGGSAIFISTFIHNSISGFEACTKVLAIFYEIIIPFTLHA